MAGTIVAGTLSDGTYSGSVTDTVRGACRAWVNFNGTGTVAIRAAYNVSSITDNGTGNYTVNFTTAMPDANFVVMGTSSTEPTAPDFPNAETLRQYGNGSGLSASSVCLLSSVVNDAGRANIDRPYLNVAIFR